MTILIFIIILGLLVFVHELGHFLLAKRAGVAVEEFGFGYPPRAMILGRKWGTLFSLNWIPFGGFVKILGEDYENELESEKAQGASGKRFIEVSKKWQATILLAGIIFNLLFAWFLFSLSFMIGVPASVDNDFGGTVRNPELTIVTLLPDYPAEQAGLKSGDKIKNLSEINSAGKVLVVVDRAGEILNFEIEPKFSESENKKIIGISMDTVGTLSLPIHQALWQGGKATLRLTYLTAAGILSLIKNAVVGEANINDISGPVGIVGLVGDATRLGFAYLVTFTALISINLAIVNLVPFPALDGGRVLFVIIESITKRPINQRIAGHANTIGFALLILLMIFITYHDIVKLF